MDRLNRSIMEGKMKFTNKDVADIFNDILTNTLVTGNTGCFIASANVDLNVFWSSGYWATEDGIFSAYCEDPPETGWQDVCR